MSSLYARASAVIALTAASDYRNKEGYTVTFSGATATISSSSSAPATGVILEGANTDGDTMVGILGSMSGTVRLKTSGAITKGARVQQAADGTILTDAASGARVIIGVALETGVSGDLIEVATFAPLTLS
jgi:hypothetical protein